MPTSERFPTAHLLNANERFFLIDCGEGTQIQLRKYRIKIGKINHIFISHLHGDHIFGLFGLISSFCLLGRTSKLHIYGPEMLEELLLDHLKYFQNDLTFELIIHTFQNKRSALIYHDKTIEVRTVPLLHRIPTCGFLFKEKPVPKNIKKELVEQYKIPIREIVKIKNGSDFVTVDGIKLSNDELTLPSYRTRSYAYCSDTAYDEKITEYIKSVDILYHEATFTHKDADLASETFHSTTKQAAEIAKKAGAGKLLIGHFSSRYKKYDDFEKEAREVFENTVAINDGDIFSVPKVREKDH